MNKYINHTIIDETKKKHNWSLVIVEFSFILMNLLPCLWVTTMGNSYLNICMQSVLNLTTNMDSGQLPKGLYVLNFTIWFRQESMGLIQQPTRIPIGLLIEGPSGKILLFAFSIKKFPQFDNQRGFRAPSRRTVCFNFIIRFSLCLI